MAGRVRQELFRTDEAGSDRLVVSGFGVPRLRRCWTATSALRGFSSSLTCSRREDGANLWVGGVLSRVCGAARRRRQNSAKDMGPSSAWQSAPVDLGDRLCRPNQLPISF